MLPVLRCETGFNTNRSQSVDFRDTQQKSTDRLSIVSKLELEMKGDQRWDLYKEPEWRMKKKN